MAILGYALEYELMPFRGAGRISTRSTEELFLLVENSEINPNMRLIFFLRVDYGCYNVLILRLLRYI